MIQILTPKRDAKKQTKFGDTGPELITTQNIPYEHVFKSNSSVFIAPTDRITYAYANLTPMCRICSECMYVCNGNAVPDSAYGACA